MTILNRYIFRAVVGMTAFVMLVLLALGAFIDFISEQDSIGVGNYGVPEALLYVLLKLPRIAVGLLPVSALLGALLGLGALATHSELVVMRSSGVSLGKLARAVLMAGVTMAVFGGFLGEYISPPMDRYARQLKAFSKTGEVDIAGGENAWVRDGGTVFNVSRARDGGRFGGVYIFTIGDDGELAALGRADSAEVDDQSRWLLNNFAETSFTADGVSVRNSQRVFQTNNLNSDLLALTVVRASSLDGIELYQYIQYLRNNGLDAARYEIAFWSRIASAAGVAFMCVLALPFVLGGLRTAGAGARMLIGVSLGLGYFLLSRTMADSGAVYDLNPFLVAWLPTLVLAGITVIALGRTR